MGYCPPKRKEGSPFWETLAFSHPIDLSVSNSNSGGDWDVKKAVAMLPPGI